MLSNEPNETPRHSSSQDLSLPSKEVFTAVSTSIVTGIAAADSFGLAVEGLNAAEIVEKFGGPIRTLQPISGIKYYKGEHPAGTISDDTLLTIATMNALRYDGLSMDAVARSLIEAYDHAVQHTPDTPHPLGWGWSVGDAVLRLKQGAHWSQAGLSDNPQMGLGNGVVIRIAPVALELWRQGRGLPLDQEAKEFIRDFTYLTHKTETALMGSYAYVSALLYALSTSPHEFSQEKCIESIEEALNDFPNSGDNVLAQRIRRLHEIQVDNGQALIEECCNTGRPSFIGNSLPATLAVFLRNPADISALNEIVNLGEDADSNGSMV
ncbi:MAG: ADP-ribosylglycohydrolase family protein, partial [Bdellovibrionales bacterium]|nr:ADP-ribosylglycohydrolase family protein [Bdellovibrionales bacterium]